jgi:hypothetical protein
MNSSSRTILSRLALLATLALTPLLMTDANAFGGKPGGPYSNGTYFPNEGTFSAVLRAENLIGTLQFSTSSSSASSGVATIYNDGDTYIGNSSGSFDPSSNKIDVTFQASIPGQGQQTISVQTPVTTQVTTFVTTNGTVTPVQTQQTEFMTTREILYYDSLYCNGSANCKTSNDLPNQKFSGFGQAEFQTLIFTGNTPFLDSVTKDISVSGVRLSNSAAQFATADIIPPSVNEFTVLVP